MGRSFIPHRAEKNKKVVTFYNRHCRMLKKSFLIMVAVLYDMYVMLE